MRWVDDAIILRVKKTGENSATLSLLTHNHGRHMGLFSGIKNKKNKAFLQEASLVKATWKARLESQLGRFTLEPIKLYWPQYMQNPSHLDAMLSATALIHILLAEQQSSPLIYQSFLALLEHLDSPYWATLYIRWELQLLSDIGFGLDLSQCAITGGQENLKWVSPNTGKAANFEAGLAWKDKLLTLPQFLLNHQHTPDNKELLEGFHLTGHFLQKALDFHQKNLPDARERLITRLL
ncbi:MAG: DNA repair protein RecO [Alphaproteobacteria bacterium]